MIPAIILFAVTYVLMLVFGKYRPFIALASGLIFLITGMLPISELLPSIDFNVLLMIAGTWDLFLFLSKARCPHCLPTL